MKASRFREWIKKLSIAIVVLNLILGFVPVPYYLSSLISFLFVPAILAIIYLFFVGDIRIGNIGKRKWVTSETDDLNKDALVYRQGASTVEELIDRFDFKVNYHHKDLIFIDKTTTNIIIKTGTSNNNKRVNKENRSPKYVMLRRQDVRRMTNYGSAIEFELYDNEVPFVFSTLFKRKLPLSVPILLTPFTIGSVWLMYPFFSIPDTDQVEQYSRRITNMWNFG